MYISCVGAREVIIIASIEWGTGRCRAAGLRPRFDDSQSSLRVRFVIRHGIDSLTINSVFEQTLLVSLSIDAWQSRIENEGQIMWYSVRMRQLDQPKSHESRVLTEVI